MRVAGLGLFPGIEQEVAEVVDSHADLMPLFQGFGFRVCGFGSRVSGSGSRVPGSGLRSEG